MAMAFRHRQHLIFQHFQAIFEGTEDKEKVSAVMAYILGVGERSEKAFLEALKNTKLTVKPEVMSTLEQILERGREEGLYKKSIFDLLKTDLRFPGWSAAELADFTELELPIVKAFLEVVAQKDQAVLQRYIREELLTDIPLTAKENEKLARLSEELAGKKGKGR